ncbi:MAG: MiaB/RimO family radical SAM methylthiotransferase [Candidatus Gottesmanbacteria bacterium]|nr:MiaB/RimO family radical SAM methylthiotransferase [Candidatus Gottesmanbacteria bacterium]
MHQNCTVLLDSERIAAFYEARGYKKARSIQEADDVVINTCMVRQKAEDRVYGIIYNLNKLKMKNSKLKIILTGCMVGMSAREKTGKMFALLQKRMPAVDEFLPIEEVGFDHAPVRSDTKHALVPVTNGCNNFCTFCVVPFTRGREVSRPVEDILTECHDLANQGYTHVTLIGQNVNSYGSDLKNNTIKPVYVKHLGRLRIPTLFPYLLEKVSNISGLKVIDFISSNPWDFSDELIDVIAGNKNISRHIHLPVQSGDNTVLARMNRWYTREEYLSLIKKLRKHIPGVTISTDIIVGFCGETKTQFNNTVSLVREVGFSKAYVAMYSDRPMTAAHKVYKDDVPHAEKKRRWAILEELINKTNLKNGTYI